MAGKTISCALTTYNSNAFLEKQLDSLKNQQLPFDEVIIIDDASTNDTVDRLHAYIDQNQLENWKVIVHEENKGFIESFRDSLKYCTKDLIFLCDHDDLWYKTKTQVMKDEFEQYPDLKVLACSFDLIDENDEKIEDTLLPRRANHNLIRRPIDPGLLNVMKPEDLVACNIAPGCSMAMTRDVAEKYIDLAGDLHLPHDWAISIIAALEDGLCYLDQPLMGYRQHDANTLGLARRSEFEKRTDAAGFEADQKKDMVTLFRRMTAERGSLKLMENVSQAYGERYEAMMEHSLYSLAKLLFSPVAPGFKLTIGMDIKSMLTGRSRPAERPAQSSQKPPAEKSSQPESEAQKTDPANAGAADSGKEPDPKNTRR